MIWGNKSKRGATVAPTTPRHVDKAKADKPAATPNRRTEQPKRVKENARQSGFALRLAMQRLQRNRIGSLMVVLVVATALMLPAGLQVFMANMQVVESSFKTINPISLYLHRTVTENQALALSDKLKNRRDVQNVQYISPQQALDEFQNLSGFGDVLNELSTNPLPTVLVITPKIQSSDVEKFDTLVGDLQNLPEVELAQADTTWLKRLFAIASLFEKVSLIITVFLVFAVLVVVGNTIRMQSQSYRDEILVCKLVGATDGFVRRPFLYTGMFYGLVGAALAGSTMWVTLFWLEQAVANIASLYQSEFHLLGLGLTDFLALLGLGAVLGLGGSWIAVNRFLNQLNL